MIACFTCCLVLDGIAYVFGVFLDPMVKHYGVDNAQMATVGSVLSGTIQLVGLVAGAGLGLMYVPAMVAVGMYFDKKRAMATGFVCSGSGAGTFLLAPLAQLLIDSIGWQGAIKVFAGMCLACAICGLTMKPLPKRPSPDNEEDMNCVKKIVVGSCNP